MGEGPYNDFYKLWFDMSRGFFPFWVQPEGKAKGPYAAVPEWMKDLQRFLEKVLWFPPFTVFQGTGKPLLEIQKEYFELAGAYMNLYREWIEVYSGLSRAWVEGTTNALGKPAGKSPEASMDYQKMAYQEWIEQLSERFDTLLRDSGFSSKLASLLSAVTEVKKRTDSLVEKYSALMNMPTRSEIDTIYKELYDLRKRVGEISKIVEEKGRRKGTKRDTEGAKK